MQMTGNTILMTGGGSGIGRAIAEAFHKRGNTVVIAGRRREPLDATVAATPGMIAMTFDVGDAADIERFASEVADKHPALNVLINMAGVMKNESVFDTKDVEATIATNLLGPIRLTAALLPTLRGQPNATVMNVSSGLAFVPLAMTPTYCATKAAIHSYTQSLRYQLRDTGVSVLELIPPYVQTTLMGERQANDPMAMPLDAYVTEVMSILESQPDEIEICVKNVDRLRYAADGGEAKYRAMFNGFNDAMSAARSSEVPH